VEKAGEQTHLRIEHCPCG